jgi:hypothetical protein
MDATVKADVKFSPDIYYQHTHTLTDQTAHRFLRKSLLRVSHHPGGRFLL